MGKEIITFGVAGMLETEGFEPKQNARVRFEAEAVYSSATEKFAKGDITHVLTIDPKTFEITRVDEPPEQLEMGDGTG